jgi:2-keto-4-pentenoate hydratase
MRRPETEIEAAEVDDLARALLAARRTHKPVSAASIAPIDTAVAYRIQDAVARHHGGIEGWKVGARSRDATPTCAPLLRGTVTALSGIPVCVAGAVGVEVEIAYRIGRDFPARCAFRDEEVPEAIADATIAVELCATRLAADARSDPLWLLADNQMNERLIVGPSLACFRDLHFASLAARLAVNGATLVSRVGGHPAEDPVRLLVWLVRHCVQHRDGVQSGQIITTGSWTGMPVLAPPVQLTAEFSNLAAITFDIVGEPRE